MVLDTSSISVRPKRRIGRILLTILVCTSLAVAIYVRNVTKSRATPPPPLPVPNAYDGLLRAAELVPNKLPNEGNFQTAKLEDLRAFVDANAALLAQTLALIGKPSRVPLIYEYDLEKAGKRVGPLRQLSRLLSAEGELALKENHFDDAARTFLDINQLGPAIGRGGLLLDVLMGIAVESMGQSGLRRAYRDLGKERLREALAILRQVDDSREKFSAAKNNELYWFEQSQPLYIQFVFRVNRMYDALRESSDKAGEAAIQRVQTGNRQLQLDIARQLYMLDHGQEPEDPAQLVPTYLPEIPKNPKSGEPITGAVVPAPQP